MQLPDDLLRRLDVPGPRYTSYPSADRFTDGFGVADYRRALRARPVDAPLSLYVHIPFCESICYYCACNKVITRHHERAADYLDAIDTEVDLHVAEIGAGAPVTQVHLGGGTPTFLSDAELERLMKSLRRAFAIADDAEVSIEVDPRTATPARLGVLRGLGFNRLSFGIQDFDADVQQAVHRIQPFDSVRELMAGARTHGFESINADLIYGLPRQTPASFARTLAQVSELRPDRIALYGYAHLPERFKPQRRIDDAALPGGEARIRMLGAAIGTFLEQGYDYIGMDHFALAGDALAAAKREGRLQRNFQGYSTQPECDLIGLGVSSIGRVGATYSQNAKALPEYYAALQRAEFPTARGLALSADDLLRRDVIMALMCQGQVDLDAIGAVHAVTAGDYFATEIEALQSFVDGGIVDIDGTSIRLTPLGWYFVRGVAMQFDRHLRAHRNHERFSRIL